MSALSAVGRLTRMDRDEVQFRLTCAARRVAGRLHYTIRPPHWDRAAIRRVLRPESGPLVARACEAAGQQDYPAAQRALIEHIRTRDSSWPLRAKDRGQLPGLIHKGLPDAAAAARARGDRIIDGRYDLLGYRDLALGNPPDWHADVVHQRHAPRDYWTTVRFLDPQIGDHKIIWELNRQQHFLALGSADWLTGDARYRGAFIAQLEDWLRVNPPLCGGNWSSMLELAFRTISWAWAIEFFAAGKADEEEDGTPWLVDLLVALDRQLTHVAHNLSTYFSPNTHLSGEALALYAVSTAFPELARSAERAAAGRKILVREAHHQIRADGGHVELSAHYHRYSTDFYLLALMVARNSGDPAASAFEQAASKQAAYLRTIADDRGRLPLLGDDDGGQLFRFGGSTPADASATLAAAASLLSDASLSVGSAPVETWWTLGRPPVITATGETTRWPSRLLPDSGYLVSRSPDGGHLIFDAGPHGFLNGGHAHSDALAVVLTVGREPLLVDPGSATYTMDAEVRDRFRSSRMHNTILLDGQDHATPNGPFHWRTKADARFLVTRIAPEFDFAVGTHGGYRGPRHLRAVLAVHGAGWLIVDRIVTNRPTVAQAFWHFHPDWHASLHPGTVELHHGSGRRLALATTAAEVSLVEEPALSVWSPEYGRLEPATTIVAKHTAATPFVIATFIPAATATDEPVTIAEIARATSSPDGWTEAAFAVRSAGEDVHLAVAFPSNDEAQPSEDWPQPCITRHRVVRTI
jgi:hypothetical protein